MTLRTFFVALACAAPALSCGSPSSPTPTGPPASVQAAPSAAGQTASPPPASTPGSLKVESAAVVEFQYPGYSGYYYAPQVRVTESSGTGWVKVGGAEIRIPGYNVWTCSTGQTVLAGQSRELFPEIYGDYPLTFDRSGQRSSGDALIVIRFVDQLGHDGELTVTAPIRPGSLPTTYTGGTGVWSCR